MADNPNFPTSPHPDISFPVNRPTETGVWSPELDAQLRAKEASTVQSASRRVIPRAFYPGGDRSLSGIALRAFLLGVGAAIGLSTSALFLYHERRLWRPVFFVGTLSVFHFLEFWTTAEYNTPTAFVSSFLLTNGSRYRQAHTFAFFETLITSYLFPEWQARINPPFVVALGLTMIVVGQVVRSSAMVQAGTNFNHQVQSHKNEGHELVTTGLYGYLRHPSYFGFFWWGLGTQVALGNSVSLVGYAFVLWYFFKHRIRRMFFCLSINRIERKRLTRSVDEEKHLVAFFGEEYKAYRARTRVWIPFIR
jgi:protein-S-isoprenylcysteine O-methyltransferase